MTAIIKLAFHISNRIYSIKFLKVPLSKTASDFFANQHWLPIPLKHLKHKQVFSLQKNCESSLFFWAKVAAQKSPCFSTVEEVKRALEGTLNSLFTPG